MKAVFPDQPEALANTQRVADLCEFDFEKKYFLPGFPRPAEYASDESLLEHLARAGAERRYGAPLPPEVEQRLGYELGVINKAGYAGYFLIVQDFIAAARDRGIPVGPGSRLGRGLHRGLRPRHHQRVPAPVRPAVRAIPQSRAGVDARHRRGLLLRAPG